MNIYERVEHRMMNKTKNRSSRATNPLTSPLTTSQRLHHASTMLPYMNKYNIGAPYVHAITPRSSDKQTQYSFRPPKRVPLRV